MRRTLQGAQVASALLAGALFGVGLVLSGMVKPTKVINFLDVTGDWDPSLALVMGGAMVVHSVAYVLVGRRGKPLFADRLSLPTRRDLDPKLVGGAALFGVGWGLGGLCPGPGLVASAAAATDALVFVGTMVIGMALASRMESP
jgi:uncharacterized membrane protein YedE/YeeE